MTATIDLELAVDTETLIAEYPNLSDDPDRPTALCSGICYLVGPPAAVTNGQASDRLKVVLAAEEDGSLGVLRWRSVSLTGNSEAAVTIYAMRSMRTAGPRSGVLGPFQPIVNEAEIPLPILVGGRNTDPPSFTAQKASDYFVEAPIQAPGRVDVQFNFYLTVPDEQKGTPRSIGFCAWAALLTLTRGGV